MGRYGCVLQAMAMMILALVAMGLYEYGLGVPAAVLAVAALGIMGWGLVIVNRSPSGKDD